ncbi:MAG: DNA polymerase III subunit gamma/tau [Candidatus Yonathbacteria bacterium]|nr:DNA polymerase III subunit gamma/tau [Candidatus Yonathbacteria bacterium]
MADIPGVALYRKYRPQSWNDVLGQEHVVNVLLGAIEAGNIAHAYLFAGSRGTGKTSVARIFARSIGCSDNDLYEIDAASNRGIDDIRELRDGVRTLPFESPYKVYIIDEVHMLTKEAFNALLKTLEEPPKHVVFILATTEPNKLPETVISRCQTFTFKKPSHAILKDLIAKIAKKEGFSIESASADLIAVLGDGSFRDAQGILQKVLSSSKDKKVSVEEVLEVTGSPKSELINNFISALAEKDVAKGMGVIQKASKENIDMNVFLRLALHKVRMILLLRFAKDMEAEIEKEFTEEDFTFLKDMSGKSGAGIASKTLEALLLAHSMMRYSAIPELPLELLVMKLDDRQSIDKIA